MNHPLCECGRWSGERCEAPLDADVVVIEFMPQWLRDSHTSAGNPGVWPANGAERILCRPDCAALIVSSDGKWATVSTGAD